MNLYEFTTEQIIAVNTLLADYTVKTPQLTCDNTILLTYVSQVPDLSSLSQHNISFEVFSSVQSQVIVIQFWVYNKG